MGRPRRYVEPGGFYHVTSRGSNKQPIYLDRVDRLWFLNGLTRVVRRFGWVLHAYCLMTNHYHLVVEVPECGLSEGMCELNGGYSRQTNRRHDRCDHLFRNRFFSGHLTRDAHLLASCRYAVLNPVRAGICSSPADWEWSSYRACAGLEFANAFLSTDAFLRMFSPDPEDAHKRYRAFVRAT